MTNTTETDRRILFPRERLAAYWSVQEFRALALACVPRAARGNALRTLLERSTSRAVLALGQAADGDDRRAKQRLESSRAALDKSLMLLEQLLFEERIAAPAFEQLLQRAEVILAWLHALESMPVARWHEAEIAAPPAEAAAADAGNPAPERGVFSTLRRIREQIPLVVGVRNPVANLEPEHGSGKPGSVQ